MCKFSIEMEKKFSKKKLNNSKFKFGNYFNREEISSLGYLLTENIDNIGFMYNKN